MLFKEGEEEYDEDEEERLLQELEEKVDSWQGEEEEDSDFDFGDLRGKKATGLNDSRCHDFDGFDEYFE